LTHPFAPERKELDLCDWEKIGRPELLHVVINALFAFVE
jgi:ubiquitin-activating enzyme E1